METSTPEKEFQTRNSSSNFSHAINSTRRGYVFAPVRYRVKLIIFTIVLLFGVYGFVANSLVLYAKQKKRRRRRRPRTRPVARSLTEYFINSLVLSDLLSSLISPPLFAVEMFIDFIKSDSICRFNRFFAVLFPVVTILNLLVIGVQRYIAVFHPFYALRQKKIKRIVIGAWVLGLLITLAFLPAFRLVYYELDTKQNYFTLVCKYDGSAPLHKALFTGLNLFLYVIPSFILTFISIRILRRQRNSRRVEASQNTRRALSRLKVTWMFVSLIFAFIIPYMTFVLYASIRTAANVNVSFTDDYIVRGVGASLVYANASVSPTILIHYEKLYLEFLPCLRTRSRPSNRAIQPVQRKELVDGQKKNNFETTPL